MPLNINSLAEVAVFLGNTGSRSITEVKQHWAWYMCILVHCVHSNLFLSLGFGPHGGSHVPRPVGVRQGSPPPHPGQGAAAEGAQVDHAEVEVALRDAGGQGQDTEAAAGPQQRHGGLQQMHRRQVRNEGK